LSDTKVRVQRLSESAAIPVRGSQNAAGYDLFAAEQVRVPGTMIRPYDTAHIGNAVVPTGLAFEIPHGFYGRIVERSGLAFRQHLHCGSGVIDSDYRGEVRVLVYNFSDQAFVIEQGMRFAQIIFERIGEFEIEESNELATTDRGTGGFGSTGI
jgi:dUTP pyrophosphatase